MTMRIDFGKLEAMSPSELQAEYARVFDEPSRSRNRRWLVRRIAWRLQAQQEGGLTERARLRAAELARDEDLRVRAPAEPPVTRTRPVVAGGRAARRDARLPIPGTVLVRVFRGEEHRAVVLPDGIEYDGTIYRSLSAVAHAISGSNWNGYRFFGLTKPGSEGR